MTRTARLSLTVPFLALSLAACAKDPTSGKSQAVVNAPIAEGVAAAPGPGQAGDAETDTLAVTPATSKLGFVGAKVTAQHVGGFQDFAGTITLVDGAPEKSRVELTVKTASLTVEDGGDQLANHLRSPDFFDVEKHPTASFVSTTITPGSDVAGMTHTVTGNLEIRGTKKSVTFPATIQVTPATVQVKSEFGINRKDFGIEYPGMKDDLIKDNVLIRVDLNAPRTPGKA